MNKINVNQNGFSIYLIIIILTIVSILLSVTLYGIHSTRKSASAEMKKFQARMLAESGIVRAEYFLSGGDGHSLDWETDNYKEEMNDFGTISIKNKRFGVYSEIEASGKRLDYTCTIKGLFGRDLPPLLDPVITLTGHAGGLELKKESKISGTVVLFHGGIKNSNIPVIIRSSPVLPFDSTSVYKAVKRCDDQFLSLLTSKNVITGNAMITSANDSNYTHDTLIFMGDCELNNVTLQNRLLAVSGKLIIIGNCKIEKSALFCEKCEIRGGLTNNTLFYSQKKMSIENGIHNAQFIATDSIKISNSAHFGVMATCVNYRDVKNDTLVSGGVYLERKTHFRGIIISAMDSIAKKREWRPSVVLDSLAEVNGMVITDQSIFMKQNRIKGNIWARQIETTDEKLSYTNYLINCQIESGSEKYSFPLFGPRPVKIRLGEHSILYTKSIQIIK